MSITAYLNGLQIANAQLMLQADPPMPQVLLAYYFCNQSHFNLPFNKVTGITPGK